MLAADRFMSEPFALADDPPSDAGSTWRERQLCVRLQSLAHADDPGDRRSHEAVLDARLRQELHRPRSAHP